MLRPAAVHAALETLLVAPCDLALLALPDSGLLYASAALPPQADASDAADGAARGAAGPSTSALMRGAPDARLGIGRDERARLLAAIATQAWREEPKPSAGARSPPVLIDTELGASMIYSIQTPAALLLVLTAPSAQLATAGGALAFTAEDEAGAEAADGSDADGVPPRPQSDPWADMLERARAFDEHIAPELAAIGFGTKAS